MAGCECIAECPFYNDKMDSALQLGPMYKRTYCLGDKTHCARYMVFEKLGKEKVPEKLYPISVEQAKGILDAA